MELRNDLYFKFTIDALLHIEVDLNCSIYEIIQDIVQKGLRLKHFIVLLKYADMEDDKFLTDAEAKERYKQLVLKYGVLELTQRLLIGLANSGVLGNGVKDNQESTTGESEEKNAE